jgi:hypothetical protein
MRMASAADLFFSGYASAQYLLSAIILPRWLPHRQVHRKYAYTLGIL